MNQSADLAALTWFNLSMVQNIQDANPSSRPPAHRYRTISRLRQHHHYSNYSNMNACADRHHDSTTSSPITLNSILIAYTSMPHRPHGYRSKSPVWFQIHTPTSLVHTSQALLRISKLLSSNSRFNCHLVRYMSVRCWY